MMAGDTSPFMMGRVEGGKELEATAERVEVGQAKMLVVGLNSGGVLGLDDSQ